MTERAAAILLIALLSNFSIGAQTPAVPPDLKFEVASIKPSPPGGRGGGIRPSTGGERYIGTNVPLKALIRVAWRVKDDQIVGGPPWLDTDRFDMNAKAEKASNTEELHMMLKNLLADEFHLQFHRETKELPIYVLSVDKSGAKMTPHGVETTGETWIDNTPDQHPGAFLKTNWHATLTTMDYFAFRLGEILDRPVIDRTGLKGAFDFDLKYTRELPPGIKEGALINGAEIDTSGPSLFEAIRQQLGLKLDAQKGPVEIMAIDRAEKPTGN